MNIKEYTPKGFANWHEYNECKRKIKEAITAWLSILGYLVFSTIIFYMEA